MDPIRDKVREKLGKVVPDTLAEHIETCIFNWAIRHCHERQIPKYWKEPKFRYMYTMKVMSIHFNLTNPENPALLEKVLHAKVGPKELVNAHPAKLFPEKWDVLYERAAEKQLRKQLTTDIDSVPEGMIQCGKCKSKKTTYTQLQTRSGDEGENQTGITLNSTVNYP